MRCPLDVTCLTINPVLLCQIGVWRTHPDSGLRMVLTPQAGEGSLHKLVGTYALLSSHHHGHDVFSKNQQAVASMPASWLFITDAALQFAQT